jgi:hypothetical protein
MKTSILKHLVLIGREIVFIIRRVDVEKLIGLRITEVKLEINGTSILSKLNSLCLKFV